MEETETPADPEAPLYLTFYFSAGRRKPEPTPRPPGWSASPYRRRCSPAPTRRTNEQIDCRRNQCHAKPKAFPARVAHDLNRTGECHGDASVRRIRAAERSARGADCAG